MDRKHGEDDAEALRRRRRVLEGHVDGVSVLLASRHGVPTARDFLGLEQATAATLEALAELLDAIDGALADEGRGGDPPRIAPQEVLRLRV